MNHLTSAERAFFLERAADLNEVMELGVEQWALRLTMEPELIMQHPQLAIRKVVKDHLEDPIEAIRVINEIKDRVLDSLVPWLNGYADGVTEGARMLQDLWEMLGNLLWPTSCAWHRYTMIGDWCFECDLEMEGK